MSYPENIVNEFEINPIQLQELKDLMGGPASPFHAATEYALFDTVDNYAPAARQLLPGITASIQDVSLHGAAKVVAVHLPPSTSECYGPTPTTYLPAEPNVFPSDVYRALFASLPDVQSGRGLYAYGRTNVLQENVLVPTDISNVPRRRVSASPAPVQPYCTDIYANRNQQDGADPRDKDRNASPDVLSMHFIRNFEGADLLLTTFDLAELSARSIELLRQPILHLPPRLPHLKPQSILYGPHDNPRIRYNHYDFTEDTEIVPSKEARAALKELDEHLNDRIFTLAVKAGSIIFLDNRNILHGRPGYEPLCGGNARWQRRVYHSTSAERIAQFEKAPRLIDTSLVYAS